MLSTCGSGRIDGRAGLLASDMIGGHSGIISWIYVVWVRDDLAGHRLPDLHARFGPAYALYKHRTSCERCGQG